VRSATTITDVLRRHAATRGEQTAFVYLPDGEHETERLDFFHLERRASAVASELERRRMRGERVVLMFSSGLEFISAFFGCLAAGSIAVPMCPPRRAEALDHTANIVRAAGASLVLTDAITQAHLSRRVGEAWASGLPVEDLSWLADAREVEARIAVASEAPRAEDTAFLQFTSGSTGTPKGVVVTHANILANQRAIQRGFRHGEDTVVVSWLPFHHDMGLVGMVMQPVYLGRPCVLMPPEMFIQKPLRWLKALARYRGTTSGGPNFGYQRCLDGIGESDMSALIGLDLRAWTVAFAGAEPVRAECLQRFARTFAGTGFDAHAFYPCYGLAEATLMVTGVESGRPLRIEQLDSKALGGGRAVEGTAGSSTCLVSCGRSWGEDRVVIADPDTGRALPENVVGEIWVIGPSVANGYFQLERETAETFGATSADYPGQRFLRTGDLGFVRDGELFIAGRSKDLLIINGRNHYPQDIESTVAALHPAFRSPGAVFADDDVEARRIVLVQDVYPHRLKTLDIEATTDLIVRRVGAVHELRLNEVFFTTSRLPTTTSGKIRRRACRDAWRAGRLTPARRSENVLSPPNVKGAHHGPVG
jgi:myxalamid-type polyketide synthase MxaB